MARIVCVLYEDPVNGYPKTYARDDIPKLERYPDGNKSSSAQLKKAYALLELQQKQAGVRELRSLIQRYPNTNDANLARQRLKKLGIAVR